MTVSEEHEVRRDVLEVHNGFRIDDDPVLGSAACTSAVPELHRDPVFSGIEHELLHAPPSGPGDTVDFDGHLGVRERLLGPLMHDKTNLAATRLFSRRCKFVVTCAHGLSLLRDT